jgi:hypothetical protein
MHLSFKDFVRENRNTLYLTFARMNPPTRGHQKLMDSIAESAGKNPYRIYLSQKCDQKKNPLLYEDKIKIVRRCFPRHSRSIYQDKNVRNILEAATAAYDSGYKNIVLLCGEDRISDFNRVKLYNDKTGQHGYYCFESIKIKSIGKRNSDTNTIEGISATILREAAENSDFTKFSCGVPTTMSDNETKELYNKVRVGLGIKEESKFKNHIDIRKNCNLREKYVSGELFNIGDNVTINETDEVVKITTLGANYVIVENANGERFRKWLDDVKLL